MISNETQLLNPLANAIVDRAIDNVTRKLVAGHRNKKNSRPNAKTADFGSAAADTLGAVSATSVMEVANRGGAWKEMLQKTLSHGVSSIGTMKFDGSFTIKDGIPKGLENVPNSPGVYVIFNQQGEAVYVGDSAKLKSRWQDGHLNQYGSDERSGKTYKLAEEFQNGCTIKFVKMETKETAAAVEAHLIAKEKPKRNKRKELEQEQGTRSNIEAKKMKDVAGSASTIAMGAGREALKNVGWGVFEQLTTELLKALKDELVEIVNGVSRSIKHRIQRVLGRVWRIIKEIINAPIKILSGIFEFIVNAVSKTIAQFYNLAKNIYDLGLSAWQLFNGAKTMTTDQLVQKITETMVLSGTLILWDALDPVLEAHLSAVVGPVAPYLSAAICAIGYGVSGFYLQKLVPALVKLLIFIKSNAQEAAREMKFTCERLISVQERELLMLVDLRDYVENSFDFEIETRANSRRLSGHQPVAALDFRDLLAPRKNT